MRLLLDQSVPSRLRHSLSDHSVRTVVEAGWSGVKNGKLLALAAAEFDTLPIALIVLDAVSNELPLLLPLVPALLQELSSLRPKSYTLVKVT